MVSLISPGVARTTSASLRICASEPMDLLSRMPASSNWRAMFSSV
jgi:hypothetical protein